MPGMKWSTVLDVASIGTRVGAAHVVSLVDLASTMSLLGQPDRKRQSGQLTYTVPAPSISAEGSVSSRRPPATVWWLIDDTRTVARQVAPPSTDRNARIWSLRARYGTMTVPLGRTTGCPPSPVGLLLDVRAGPHVSPPSVDVFMRIASPEPLMSYSV